MPSSLQGRTYGLLIILTPARLSSPVTTNGFLCTCQVDRKTRCASYDHTAPASALPGHNGLEAVNAIGQASNGTAALLGSEGSAGAHRQCHVDCAVAGQTDPIQWQG
jgi:hypothetical protein